jgi:enamidase
MKIAVTNVETIVTGDMRAPTADGGTILLNNGVIESIGASSDISDCDVVIDAGGMTAVPGRGCQGARGRGDEVLPGL